MQADSYNFEIKCRRCGEMTERSFAEKKDISYQGFQRSMENRIYSPRQYMCSNCGKYTVQEVVSFTDDRD
jgi:rRNA maturation protein Nop10